MDQSLTRLNPQRLSASSRPTTAVEPIVRPGRVSLCLLWVALTAISSLWVVGLITVLRWMI